MKNVEKSVEEIIGEINEGKWVVEEGQLMKSEPIKVNLGNPLVKKEFELVGKICELEDYITGLDLDSSELVRLLTTIVKNVSDKRPGGSKYEIGMSIMSKVVNKLLVEDNGVFEYDLYNWDLLREEVYWGVNKESKEKYDLILEIEKNEGIDIFRTLYSDIEDRQINPMYIDINRLEYQMGGDFLTYYGLDTSNDPNNEDYEEFDREDYVVEFLKEFSEWNRNRKIEKVIGVVGPGGGLYK